MWWCTLVVPVLGGLKQENFEFEVSLGYVVRPWLAEQQQQKKWKEGRKK
jgi:hypothetical protein